MDRIGIIGGTGPQGRGLALRWAQAGHEVLLGSRSEERAAQVVDEMSAGAAEALAGRVRPAANDTAAAEADIVVVAVPYEGQRDTLMPLRDAIGSKIVVNVVNPMVFDDVGPKAVPVAAGSAAEECQQVLTGARVVSAFHEVPARRLRRLDGPVDSDVLICGDDDDAVETVARLAEELPGVRAVVCGPLRNSQHLENLTPVLLFINRRYRTHAALRIDGVTQEAPAVT